MIKTTKNSYELLQGKLTEIEKIAISGILNGNAEDRLRDVRNLVFETRQCINQSFYVAGDDEPPAA
jgi:hypothetical protein